MRRKLREILSGKEEGSGALLPGGMAICESLGQEERRSVEVPAVCRMKPSGMRPCG
ncbi:MAG: hypothetical protein HFI35_14670 [Roseburia sp.]|nr:hypothetical protein [Roseburia sp.]